MLSPRFVSSHSPISVRSLLDSRATKLELQLFKPARALRETRQFRFGGDAAQSQNRALSIVKPVRGRDGAPIAGVGRRALHLRVKGPVRVTEQRHFSTQHLFEPR